MKCQKKSEEKKSNPIPACPAGNCRPENGLLTESSLFQYSIIEIHPMHYEYGSNPVWIDFTEFALSRLSAEIDLTMKDPENYFKYAEKYFQSQIF